MRLLRNYHDGCPTILLLAEGFVTLSLMIARALRLIILTNNSHLVRGFDLSVRDGKLWLQSLVVELRCGVLVESELLSGLSCSHLLIHLSEATASSELDRLREILIEIHRLIILLSWLMMLVCLFLTRSIIKSTDLAQSILDASVMNTRLGGIHGTGQTLLKTRLRQDLVLLEAFVKRIESEGLMYFHLCLWGRSLG